MANQDPAFNLYFFGNRYTEKNNRLLSDQKMFIESSIPECIDAFYKVLLLDTTGKRFLSSEVVEERLKNELESWLADTLSPKESDEDRRRIILKHRHVGEVHARVDVPMAVVNSSMSIVKNRLFNDIRNNDQLTEELKIDLITLVNNLMDSSLSLINDSYLADHVSNERAAQEFRSRTNAHEIAIEVERIKGSLYSWMSYLMTTLLTSPSSAPVNIQNLEFTMWIRHKINFACRDDKVVGKIKGNIDQLQLTLNKLPKEADKAGRTRLIQEITDLSNECAWLLGQIAERNIDSAAREDALTSLIERRFLAPIMQSETQLAIKSKTPYSLAMLDVDNFKQINDIYGHQAGDTVLSEIGTLMKRSLRVTDYAFRYGGEEFLLLMPETSLENARMVAEKLINRIRDMNIKIDNERHLKVSASLGLAQFHDHPDFEQVIKQADEKLYHAKHNGKDRYEY